MNISNSLTLGIFFYHASLCADMARMQPNPHLSCLLVLAALTPVSSQEFSVPYSSVVSHGSHVRFSNSHSAILKDRKKQSLWTSMLLPWLAWFKLLGSPAVELFSYSEITC